ncbi:MAG TPA: Coenzyme F420 hydrogenase/dehydrogenase, beta subunit C-terminal domain [Nitriliruptorales bacterium]|nr:Coenzyme F420 hydrogenase/dehydrogenase, beta subunit C-terminal domain [Nitriliruptorales bacterium]
MTDAIRGIRDVAEKQLCTGCGVCAYMQPDAIRMVDDLDQGRRPVVADARGRPLPTVAALAACPGVGVGHDQGPPAGASAGLLPAWGPVLEVWEGHAGDPEIRFAGSSGGAATALALHALERRRMHGVLHITARPDVPYLNHTVMSRTRTQLMAATGSRYAPASPCDRLDLIERAAAPCVFIGKPCDVAAATMAARQRPSLADRLGLTIAIFCAGTPSLRGTFEMLQAMGVTDPSTVASVRYRGNGWPGAAEVTTHDDPEVRRLTYERSWGDILQKHRPWRCHVCADHTGELADVSVGDPWYRPIPPGEPGRSLVLVRTERGREIVREARASGTLLLERADPQVVTASQPNLLRARGSVWGRVVTSRAVGVAAPQFRRMPMFRFWISELDVGGKSRSVLGTLRRIVRRRLYRRRPVRPLDVPPYPQAVAAPGGQPVLEPRSIAELTR